MIDYKQHIIPNTYTIRQSLQRLNELTADAILFAVDEAGVLIGSLTDGDVRRGLLIGKNPDDNVLDFLQPSPKYVEKENYDIEKIIEFRKANFRIIPVVDSGKRVINVINFRYFNSYLPLDAVIMAGGRGSRLRPLTDTTPKPLLMVGDKAIIDHNIDRLRKFGIDDFWISINYLGEQLISHFGDGTSRGVSVEYIRENEPLGTIGAIAQVTTFRHEHILVTNSDLLTNLDYEDFYLEFIKQDADMGVVTIPYQVNIPYAVVKTNNNHVLSFEEKPTYTYYSNGGIYLMKRSVLDYIPKNSFYNATDLMEKVIEKGGKLISFPMRQYWLDVGKPEDFEKAQIDIEHLNL